jgi:MoaA/NifB/PqqE/SkfB family radical SAM enzyme
MIVHSTNFAKQLISGGLTYTCLILGGVHETVGNTPNHNLERAAYFRERYKNLTPTEREFRHERLRLYNNTPKRKGSKIEYIRKRRALLADTLSQESIAMESPTYTPEVVHPATDAIEPNGSTVTPCDWVIPEIASNPCQLQHILRMPIHFICLLDH